MLEWIFPIHKTQYELIKLGSKTIYTRIPDPNNEYISYDLIEKGHYIRFKLTIEKELVENQCLIRYIHHYDTVEELLTYEGVKPIFPGINTIEEGVQKYYNFSEYIENESKYGIYAIGLSYCD